MKLSDQQVQFFKTFPVMSRFQGVCLLQTRIAWITDEFETAISGRWEAAVGMMALQEQCSVVLIESVPQKLCTLLDDPRICGPG